MTDALLDIFENKRILVTGGLGSIGYEIVKQLSMSSVKELRVFDNRETELLYVIQNMGDNKSVVPILGDVRDKESTMRACKDVDIVFHAAALKHVLICEMAPLEAVKTNVIGTQNLIESSIQNGIDKFVMISTDKAVNPTNVMGTTKLLAERLVSAVCNQKQRGKTKFSTVRFGNVMASRGSVLEIWNKDLKKGKKIAVTDPDMTRFIMSIPESVKLIFQASTYGEDGEIFIFKMPSVKISDLAEGYLKVKGHDPDFFYIKGSQPGEKYHEELICKEEVRNLMEDENMFVENSPFFLQEGIEKYMKLGFRKAEKKTFSSNNAANLLGKEQVIKVLREQLLDSQ
jgi:FlaA1/EpsC-like NDP-sugar epimerase